MNLFHQTVSFIKWFSRVMAAFFRARPITTFFVIGAEASAAMTRILSLLLPLKVILLAGSTSVPRYFPFIDQASKNLWIMALSVLAVAFYFLTLMLDAMVSRMSGDAGREILYKANELNILTNQEQTVKGYYAAFCEIPPK